MMHWGLKPGGGNLGSFCARSTSSGEPGTARAESGFDLRRRVRDVARCWFLWRALARGAEGLNAKAPRRQGRREDGGKQRFGDRIFGAHIEPPLRVAAVRERDLARAAKARKGGFLGGFRGLFFYFDIGRRCAGAQVTREGAAPVGFAGRAPAAKKWRSPVPISSPEQTGHELGPGRLLRSGTIFAV
jgi:hypothetical protein